jgi:predicted transcriptional regulator
MEKEALIADVRQLVAKDKLGKAIQLLSENLKGSELLDSLILQSARLHHARNERLNGTMSPAELNREFNSLRMNILSFLRREDLLETTEKPPAYQSIFRQSYARIKVARQLLSGWENGIAYTITSIQQLVGIPHRKSIVDALNELLDNELVNKEKSEEGTIWTLSPKGKEVLESLLEEE